VRTVGSSSLSGIIALKSYRIAKIRRRFERVGRPECPEVAPLWQK
jgi:hypothetical protein